MIRRFDITRCMNKLDLQKINRNYYDPDANVVLDQFKMQLQELKIGKALGALAIQSALLDPAVKFHNQKPQKVSNRRQGKGRRIAAGTQWLGNSHFESYTGNILMAECRTLRQGNKIAYAAKSITSNGCFAKLGGALAL